MKSKNKNIKLDLTNYLKICKIHLNQGFVIHVVEFLKFDYANPWLNRDAEKSH